MGFLIFGLTFISVFWKYPEGKPSASSGASKNLVIVGFCLLFLVAGIWRHQLAEIQSTKSKIRNEETVTLIGVVVSEPDIRERSQRLTIKTEQSKILLTTWRYPEYKYGDKLRITGKLERPAEDINDFNYRDYLKKDGIYSIMSWPAIELLRRGDYQGLTPAIYGKILEFKQKLRESVYQNLSPPQSSILAAMILGDKRQMSEEIKNKLNMAGIRHITAVSGLHVTVLSSILMTILLGLGFWRQQAFWFSIILIALFIAMTGLQSSAIRAGIMGGLFLLGQYLGRMSVSSRSIVFAASIMLVQNPLLLKLDVGFQLSFLAMMGIIYLMPLFRDWLKFIPWENPQNTLAMTLSAYLFTLPILIYNFSYFSLVAPLTNLLIVPLLPLIMLFGFLFAISGLIFQPLGWILSWPAWGLLTYLTKIVDWFSGLSLAYLTIDNLHWIWLIISYLILGLTTWRLQESFTRPKFL